MKKIRLKNVITYVLLTFVSIVKAQLPVWPLATAATDYLSGIDNGNMNTTIQNPTPHQTIDWLAAGGPSLNIIPNTLPTNMTPSTPDNAAATQAGFNDCGELVFYLLHNGNRGQQDALEIWDPQGNLLMGPNSSVQAPNGNLSDTEVQVVRRPGHSNQWYIIYSQQNNNGYNMTQVLYSLIEVQGNNANYVTISNQIQKDIALVAPSVWWNGSNQTPRTYLMGKAVSRTSSNGVQGDHDLYLQRRSEQSNAATPNQWNPQMSVDRFNITQNGIIWSANSGLIANSYEWSLMSPGSPIELSPDEQRLCVMARAQNNNQQQAYLFNIANGNLDNQPVRIQLSNLLIEPDVQNIATTGYNPAPGNFQLYQTPAQMTGFLSFMDNMERKMNSAEFSPSGRYLYLGGGGYRSSGRGNLTYLIQIDLDNPVSIGFNAAPQYIARVQIETISGGFNPQTGTGNNAWGNWRSNLNHQQNLYNFNMVNDIQSSIDGNLYFTKRAVNQIFVIPNPDQPMPVNLVPGIINFATPNEPNITIDGYMLNFPDQIDGYDYLTSDLERVSFRIENYQNNLNTCQKECAPVTVELYDENGLFETFTDVECDEINVCVNRNSTYHLVADNGLIMQNAIVNGVVQAENGIFDVTRDYRPLEKHLFNFEYKIPESCEMVCFDDKIEVVIEALWNGDVKHEKTETIDACGNMELCIDPFFDYYAEFNGVRHLIFNRLTGVVQNDIFSFTTEEVTAATCCPINMGINLANEDFTYISQDITINQNTTWDNKVYIEENKLVTIDGAILDVSSMDVLFGKCAGINFINGATLRANNSVFRPCDLNETWRGLVFENNSSVSETGVINECTFKNALNAVSIEKAFGGQLTSDIKLTNNLFLNCRAGVIIRDITLDKSLTGNTFKVDNNKPDFNLTCGNSGFIGGVNIDNSVINAEITQNDFVNMANNWHFIGVRIFDSSGGSLSKNTFSNNRNALMLGYSNQISIEDNEISITSLASSDQTQFNMGFNNNIRVTGNNFYNSDLNYSALTQVSPAGGNSAIAAWFGGLYNIKSNDIQGFENGVLSFRIANSNIGENNIKDAWHYGIYAFEPTNLDVSCNTINMELTDGGTTVGIGVFYQTPSISEENLWSNIRGNCIFETSTAIHIEDQSFSGNSTSPSIKNNYLYNYTNNGIAFQNVNATSAIGSGLTQTTAGKNTFISNNIPFGAVDVNASATSSTTVWGCFGVSSVNGPVNLRGGDLYNSTASCGSQIGTINSGIQADEICDQIEGNEHLYPSQSFQRRSYISTQFELIEPTEIDVNNKGNIGLDQLEIYPNPASNEVNVEINSTESDLSVINIYQINGKLIRSVEAVGQNVKVNINIQELATGAYLLKVVSNEKVIGQSKLMVTK